GLRDLMDVSRNWDRKCEQLAPDTLNLLIKVILADVSLCIKSDQALLLCLKFRPSQAHTFIIIILYNFSGTSFRNYLTPCQRQFNTSEKIPKLIKHRGALYPETTRCGTG